jgi:hypothetical protein
LIIASPHSGAGAADRLGRRARCSAKGYAEITSKGLLELIGTIETIEKFNL